MPRSPNPKIEQAKTLFKQEKKLIEIAEQLEVPEGTVRSWKNRYKWNLEDNATLQKVKCNVAKDKNHPTSKKPTKPLAEVEQVLDNPDLTDKQRLFCLYYIKSFNATQSYLKAYGCSYQVANVEGPNSLVKPRIKAEIDRLKEIKRQQIAVDESDLVEIHMRIAFADMGDYISFGREEIKVMGMFGPVKDEDGNICTEIVNTIRLKESSMVDTQLIKEVKQGKDGIAIKLIDRCKSLEWLDKHFLMNPMDKHKIEYDQRKLAIAEAKVDTGEEEEAEDDGFLDALKGQVNDVWQE